MKNLYGKTRKVEDPYEIWVSYDGTWTWHVLKMYQAPEAARTNPYARYYCAVKSPYTHGSWEYGDTYIKDIVGEARMIKGVSGIDDVVRDKIDAKNMF